MKKEKLNLRNKLNKTVIGLETQADALKSKANRIRGILYRDEFPEGRIPEDFDGTCDDYRRLILNNERLGIVGIGASTASVTAGSMMCRTLDGFHEASKDDLYNIQDIAEKGDPLCRLLAKALNREYKIREKILEGIAVGKIMLQITCRKGLTAESYQGYIDTLKSRLNEYDCNLKHQGAQ